MADAAICAGQRPLVCLPAATRRSLTATLILRQIREKRYDERLRNDGMAGQMCCSMELPSAESAVKWYARGMRHENTFFEKE